MVCYSVIRYRLEELSNGQQKCQTIVKCRCVAISWEDTSEPCATFPYLKYCLKVILQIFGFFQWFTQEMARNRHFLILGYFLSYQYSSVNFYPFVQPSATFLPSIFFCNFRFFPRGPPMKCRETDFSPILDIFSPSCQLLSVQ